MTEEHAGKGCCCDGFLMSPVLLLLCFFSFPSFQIKLTGWGVAASLYPLVPGQAHHPVSSSSTLSSSPYAYLQPDDFTVIVAAVGDQVQTAFGVAVVTAYRAPCVEVGTTASYVTTSLPTTTPMSVTSASHSAPVPFPSSATEGIVKLIPQATLAIGTHQPGHTNVGIYVCRLAWHDGGGAVAYLNGRSIRKMREPSQRRCAIQ